MPTRAGKLTPGDVLVYEKRPGEKPNEWSDHLNGVRFVVVERLGNDASYAIWLRREDNEPFEWPGDRQRNHHREGMLLEAHYHVFRQDYGLTLVGREAPKPRKIGLTQVHDASQVQQLAHDLSELLILPDGDTDGYERMARKLYSFGWRKRDEL